MNDPVCLFHGLPRSKHFCLYCCLCYKDLTVEECNTLPDGTKEDVCVECAQEEQKKMFALDVLKKKRYYIKKKKL